MTSWNLKLQIKLSKTNPTFNVIIFLSQIPKSPENASKGPIPKEMSYVFGGAYTPFLVKIIEQVDLWFFYRFISVFVGFFCNPNVKDIEYPRGLMFSKIGYPRGLRFSKICIWNNISYPRGFENISRLYPMGFFIWPENPKCSITYLL